MASIVFIEKDRARLSPGAKVIKAATYTTFREIEAALTAARDQANQIIEEAKAVYKSEMERGFAEGLRKAKKEMAAKITDTVIKTDYYFRALEKQTVILVMDIVRKVLQEIEPHDLIVSQVKKALGGMKGRKHITLKVHPAHIEILNDKLHEIASDYSTSDLIEVKADNRFELKHLILESEIGIVDASLDVQLAAIKEAFEKALKDSRPG